MNLRKVLHHEEHRDHEDFCELGIKPPIPANPDSRICVIFGNRQQGEFNFRNNSLFFVIFVFFVVQLRFIGWN